MLVEIRIKNPGYDVTFTVRYIDTPSMGPAGATGGLKPGVPWAASGNLLPYPLRPVPDAPVLVNMDTLTPIHGLMRSVEL